MSDVGGAQLSAFCRQCGYNLTALPEPRCPECGCGFDPANRRSFDCHPGESRRFRRLTRCAGAALLAVLLVFPAWNAFTHYELHRVTERCIKCGALHTCDDTYIGRYLVWTTNDQITSTPICDLLGADAQTCFHDWRPRGEQIYSRQGQLTRRAHVDEAALLSAESLLTLERIQIVFTHWPEFEEHFRRDVLEARPEGAIFRLQMVMGPSLQNMSIPTKALADGRLWSEIVDRWNRRWDWSVGYEAFARAAGQEPNLLEMLRAEEAERGGPVYGDREQIKPRWPG